MTKAKIKVAVADDQKLFRNGLVLILQGLEILDIVIEAENGKDLIMQLDGQPVDLVFVDYRMPEMNGMTATKTIRKKYPATKILMLSSYHDEEFIVSAIEHGANGYLTKDDDVEEIHRAIYSVLSIGYYANDKTSKLLINKLMTSGAMNPEFPETAKEINFTEIEIVVMRLMAKEYSTKEIAQKMVKSERTIDSHRTKIMEKTGAKNGIGIIMFAIKEKIIEF